MNLARGLMETFIAAGGDFIEPGARRRGSWSRAAAPPASSWRTADRYGPPVRREHGRRAPDLRDMVGPRPAAGRLPAEGGRASHYTPWTLFGLHLALKEAPRYTGAAFDPNIDEALKYNIGSETIASLLERPRPTSRRRRCPEHMQFGAGALERPRPEAGAAGQAHGVRMARRALRHRRGPRGDPRRPRASSSRRHPREVAGVRAEHDAATTSSAAYTYTAARVQPRSSSTCATATSSWVR